MLMTAHVELKNLAVTGKARINLGPLWNTLPIVSGLQVSGFDLCF